MRQSALFEVQGIGAMQRSDVLQALDSVLEPWRFKDYCPNGLQVEGRADIRRIVTGVTASAALIDAAIALQADAILVHHGYFWKNEDPRAPGMKKSRLAQLLAHDINLIAYHLPLDAHPMLGNNATLARVLDITPFYAILRAIPSFAGTQVWGVLGMGGAVVLIAFLSWLDKSPVKSIRYRSTFG